MKRTAFSPHDGIYINHLKTDKKHNMPVQHYHDMYEIYFQLDGTRYIFFDNVCYTLKRGNIAIFKPFEIHYAESREADYYERYVINFNPEKLSPMLRQDEIFLLLEKLNSSMFCLDEAQTQNMFYLFKMAEHYSKKKGLFSDKQLMAAVLHLIMYVIDCSDNSVKDASQYVSPCVVDAIKYMNKNYAGISGLDEIASAINVTKSHLCHKFREYTGATILEYLNNVRLTKVHSLLTDTNNSIDTIAQKTGYMSSVNMTRAFKKTYGVSPSAFRRNLKEFK